MSVVYVRNHLSENLITQSTTKFTLGKRHMNVVNVESPSVIAQSSEDTAEFTLEKSLICVVIVGSH